MYSMQKSGNSSGLTLARYHGESTKCFLIEKEPSLGGVRDKLCGQVGPML